MEQVIVWGDECLVEPRYYQCSFCKRGFLNAQALGGHMNIHRKDRAKLKEFSCEHLLSLDASRSCPDCQHGATSEEKLGSSSLESGHTKECQKEKNRQAGCLPLFADARVTSVEEAASENHLDDDHKKHVDKRKENWRYGELDLELRLGPEPHHHQEAKSNTS